jgi:hypothetical protein
MTKKALINPGQTQIYYTSGWELVDGEYKPITTDIQNGQRVAEVVELGSEFEVAAPLYWKDCADNVKADMYYLDTTTDTITAVPESAPYPG